MASKNYSYPKELLREFTDGLHSKYNQEYVDYLNANPVFCMETVKYDGWALEHVKEQTPELCMAAVQQDGYALEYVKEQTPEICMIAVQNDGLALPYVKEQTPEIIEAALLSNPEAEEFVQSKEKELSLFERIDAATKQFEEMS